MASHGAALFVKCLRQLSQLVSFSTCYPKKRRQLKMTHVDSLEERVMLSSIFVNSMVDAPDSDLTDGIAADANGEVTLRAAIMHANATPGPNTIILPSGQFNLSISGTMEDLGATGDLDILDHLVIEGTESSTIHGQFVDRVFDIIGTDDNPLQVEFRGVTISGGNGDGGYVLDQPGMITKDGGGIGAIYTDLTISNSTISGNTATTTRSGRNGGGVASLYSSLHIIDSTITGNSSGGGYNGDGGDGGGIYTFRSPTLIENSTISGNQTEEGDWAGVGGGIMSAGEETLTIRNSKITGNVATVVIGSSFNGVGGGIFATNLIIENSTIAGNQSGFVGAGIYAQQLHLVNSTIHGNATYNDSFIFPGQGGGILAETATIINSTITDNFGGGLDVGDLTMHNSIVHGNTNFDVQTNGQILPFNLSVGSIGQSQHNLIGDDVTSGGFVDGVNGNIVGVDPLLEPFNGVRVPMKGSPVIDAGNAALAPNTDQRGNSRPIGLGVDIGSIEGSTNAAPVATNLELTTSEFTPIATRVSATDDDNETLIYEIVSGPSLAANFEFEDDGTFIYEPTVDVIGDDSFTFRAFDGFEFSNIATVTIDIERTDDPPVILDQSFELTVDELGIPFGTIVGSVLASDPEGSVLFRIVGGNPSDTFTIDEQSGTLIVFDPTLIEAREVEQFDLLVEVEDSAGTTSSAVVTVNIAHLTDPDEVIDINLLANSRKPYLHFRKTTRGKVAVVLLSTSDFDATSVDIDSLTFGVDGDEDSVYRRRNGMAKYRYTDVNNDGRVDLKVYFEVSRLGLTATDSLLTLRGETESGTEFQGEIDVFVGRRPKRSLNWWALLELIWK